MKRPAKGVATEKFAMMSTTPAVALAAALSSVLTAALPAVLTAALAVTLLAAPLSPADAQAPLAGGFAGRSAELDVLHQRVSNDYGDWSGIYARTILPFERQTLFAELLALDAFRERGVQGAVTHRYDWTSRWFHMAGVAAGDGSPIFPRYRADAVIGRRWGASRAVQTIAGASVVQSIEELRDVAALGAITWYAPHGLVLETGLRYNTSTPGSIRSHRIHGIVMYTPGERRTFSARFIGGTEGWQIVNIGTTLRQFASQEAALAWRERLGSRTALNLQLDAYHNPFYTRSGVTLGVARYW